MATMAVPGSSSKVVGCVGCEVKCFNRLTNEMLPVTQYDGGKQKLGIEKAEHSVFRPRQVT